MANNSDRSKANAKYLKEHQVERSSGMCPWSCGSHIKNGGDALLLHLNKCRGKGRRDSRKGVGR